jgi:hypothetical protein
VVGRIGLVGADGALGVRTASALDRLGATVVPIGRGERAQHVDAVAVAAPWSAGVAALPDDVPAAGAALRLGQAGADTVTAPRVAAAGWFGGVGTLLAARGAEVVPDAVEVHVAYALLPSARRAWGTFPPGLRRAVIELLLGGPGTARRDGEPGEEAVGEGRRLAWFPRPVGPWHAAAVPGVEAAALPGVATVRTWLAIGSLAAEGLQALGRLDPDAGLGARLVRRAESRGGAGTDALRWAVVAEVRGADGAVHRAWANGTDPLATAAGLLARSAVRTATVTGPVDGVAGLAPPATQLDALADAGLLRWSVARPEPVTP